MQDDILDAAQKAIDDAATNTGPSTSDAPATSPTPTPPPSPSVSLPPEPEPEAPVVSSPTEVSAPPSPPPSTPSTPAPAAPTPSEESKEEAINDLFGTPTVAAPAAAPPTPPMKPKKKSKAGLIAVIAALLLTLLVAVYYISQQNQQVADIRSLAKSCEDYGSPKARRACRDYVEEQQKAAAEQQSQGTYNPNVTLPYIEGGYTKTQVLNPSAETNQAGWDCGGPCPQARDSDVAGYYKVGEKYYPIGQDFKGEGGDSGDDTTPPTATPTTGTTPICQNIKIYKGGSQVTDLSSLRAGDAVVLAVKGNLSPTKAHFRVNGGAWTETTTRNASNEWTLNYTIPTGVTDFVIEGEVFTNGGWR